MEERTTAEPTEENEALTSPKKKKLTFKERFALPMPNVIKIAKEAERSALGSWAALVLMAAVVAALLVGLPMVLPTPSGMDLPRNGFAHIVAFALAALGGVLYVRARERRSERSMGFARNDGAALCIIGGITGVIGSLVVFGFFKSIGIVEESAIHSQVSSIGLVLTFAGYIILAIGQEVFCRGYVLTSFAARYSLAVGMAVQAVVFAILHALMVGLSVFSVMNGLLMGVLFGLMFLKFGSIWPAIGFHSLWYLVQNVILGVAPVEQASSYTTVMVTTYDSSNVLLSGGMGGFEASIFAAAVYVMGIALLLLLKSRDADIDSIASVNLGETVIIGAKDEEADEIAADEQKHGAADGDADEQEHDAADGEADEQGRSSAGGNADEQNRSVADGKADEKKER